MVGLAALVTFLEGTLWHGGVRLQHRSSITALLHYYIGRDRASTVQSSRPGASPFSSQSVTVRGLFLPYLLQVEILRRDPSLRLNLQQQERFSASSCYRSRCYRSSFGIVSICNYKEGFQPTRVTDRDKPEAWLVPNPLTYRHI